MIKSFFFAKKKYKNVCVFFFFITQNQRLFWKLRRISLNVIDDQVDTRVFNFNNPKYGIIACYPNKCTNCKKILLNARRSNFIKFQSVKNNQWRKLPRVNLSFRSRKRKRRTAICCLSAPFVTCKNFFP